MTVEIKVAQCLIILTIIGLLLYGLCAILEIKDIKKSYTRIETRDYSHSGKIIDTHFNDNYRRNNRTIVQFEDGKTLGFSDGVHYEIRRHQNVTIHYSVNKYNKMFFNSITYNN